MALPLHLVEHIGTYADADTKMRMGCTCRDMRPLAKLGRIRSFIENKVMLKEYAMLKDFAEGQCDIYDVNEWINHWVTENRDHGIRGVSPACYETLQTIYTRNSPPPIYAPVDPDLYDTVVDEVKFGCLDVVLIFALWRKIYMKLGQVHPRGQ